MGFGFVWIIQGWYVFMVIKWCVHYCQKKNNTSKILNQGMHQPQNFVLWLTILFTYSIPSSLQKWKVERAEKRDNFWWIRVYMYDIHMWRVRYFWDLQSVHFRVKGKCFAGWKLFLPLLNNKITLVNEEGKKLLQAIFQIEISPEIIYKGKLCVNWESVNETKLSM